MKKVLESIPPLLLLLLLLKTRVILYGDEKS
jgi:hypothetical protein